MLCCFQVDATDGEADRGTAGISISSFESEIGMVPCSMTLVVPTDVLLALLPPVASVSVVSCPSSGDLDIRLRS